MTSATVEDSLKIRQVPDEELGKGWFAQSCGQAKGEQSGNP